MDENCEWVEIDPGEQPGPCYELDENCEWVEIDPGEQPGPCYELDENCEWVENRGPPPGDCYEWDDDECDWYLPDIFCSDDINDTGVQWDYDTDVDFSVERDISWRTFTIKVEGCVVVNFTATYEAQCEVVTEWSTADGCVVLSSTHSHDIGPTTVSEELYKKCTGIEVTFTGLREFIEGIGRTVQRLLALLDLLLAAFDIAEAAASLIEQLTEALVWDCSGSCPPGSGPSNNGDE